MSYDAIVAAYHVGHICLGAAEIGGTYLVPSQSFLFL